MNEEQIEIEISNHYNKLIAENGKNILDYFEERKKQNEEIRNEFSKDEQEEE